MTGVGGTTRHKPRGFGRWSLHGDRDSANLHLCSDVPETRSRRRFSLPRPACRRRGLRLTQSGGLLAALLSLPVDQICFLLLLFLREKYSKSASESLRASIRQLVTSSTSVGFFRPVYINDQCKSAHSSSTTDRDVAVHFRPNVTNCV